jgi:hypothetical protein
MSTKSPEFKTLPRPRACSIENLKGKIVSQVDVVSYKNRSDIQRVDVSVVEEGSGMMGLINAQDNKEWAGIFNHTLKTTRLAVMIAEAAKEKGIVVDAQLIMDAHLNSHTQRRSWDEAHWYPGLNPRLIDPAKVTAEVMGVQYLREKNAPEKVIEIVEALAHGSGTFGERTPSVAELTWEARIATYADHRTDQAIRALGERMGDFLVGWYAANLLDEQKKILRLRMIALVAWVKVGSVKTPEQAAQFITEDIPCEKISRGISIERLMQLIIDDALLEKELEEIGLDPKAWTEETVSMPRWEWYLRRLYLHDAENEIFQQVKDEKHAAGNDAWEKMDKNLQHPFWQKFNQKTWLGKTVAQVYRDRKGKPYHSKKDKPEGIDRAIGFLKLMGEKREKRESLKKVEKSTDASV